MLSWKHLSRVNYHKVKGARRIKSLIKSSKDDRYGTPYMAQHFQNRIIKIVQLLKCVKFIDFIKLSRLAKNVQKMMTWMDADWKLTTLHSMKDRMQI